MLGWLSQSGLFKPCAGTNLKLPSNGSENFLSCGRIAQ